MKRLSQPDRPLQVMTEDLVIDTSARGEFLVVDLAGEVGESSSIVIHPRSTRRGRQVVELIVETVVTQPRGHHRLEPKRRFKVFVKERF